MEWNVETTIEFLRMAKRLQKKYRTLMDDIENFKDSITENPFQGAVLTPGIRKIRMAVSAKGSGKSKGARVITLTYTLDETNGSIVLLLIYDHNQADTVDTQAVKAIVQELGYDFDAFQDEGRLK